jgi:hypothetical protein
MTAEYPKDQQNPPTEPGLRPEDQPAPQQRVPPRTNLKATGQDPRGLEDGSARGEHLEGFQERVVEKRQKES